MKLYKKYGDEIEKKKRTKTLHILVFLVFFFFPYTKYFFLKKKLIPLSNINKQKGTEQKQKTKIESKSNQKRK